MPTPQRFLFFFVLLHLGAFWAEGQAIPSPQTIVVRSGSLKLRALLWQPKGSGPFPAVLFCPGSGANPQPQTLGPIFAKHGYIFLGSFRRGQGLSASQGIESSVLVERERAAHGDDAAGRLQVKLLDGEQLDDELSALAVLRSLRLVDKNRIAVVGHSFGGSLAMLIAEKDQSIRALVSFGGGARSWPRSLYLRERLVQATSKLTTPVFLIHAANDYSTDPGKVLDAELGRQQKTHLLKIYPPFGATASEGHGLIYLSVATWERDVFGFLDQYTGPAK
jgi:dienelactone hydrolase